MKNFFHICFLFLILSFAACSGSGTSSDYFAPGYTITPPTLVAAEGNVRGAITAIDTYNFGTQLNPTDATFTLHNNGELIARISDTRFGGSSFNFTGGVFPGTGGTCTRSISADDYCTIVVRYTPTPGTSVSSLMTIDYESRDGMLSLDIRLNGTGASAPSISSLSPTSALPAGGGALTMYGANFHSDATVTVGGTTCSGVSFVSSSQLTCWIPAHASGIVSVVVTNPDTQTATYSNGFTYRAAPALATISNQTVNESVAISQINANDGGDDFDADNEAITYTCFYDMVVDGAVAASTSCASLTGISFAAATGVMDWTPTYSQSGSYEFMITGSDGALSDYEIFTITVNNVNRSPSLTAIADTTGTVGVAMTAIDSDDGGDDLDVDGNTITYSCYYDTTVDGSVADSTLCTALAGLTFNTGTGTFNWTPAAATAYEMKITGSDGSLSDTEFFTVTVSAPTWAETKLTASDAAVTDAFGVSVAVSGTSVIVGANGSGDDRGAAYVYQYDPSSSTWMETKLTASDAAIEDEFGISVAISGTTALVGAKGDATSRGAAYLYRLDPSSNTWAQTKLTASDGAAFDVFGHSVGISGTTAIVGAYGDASSRGAAYLYQLDPSANTWMETKLTASDGVAFDGFGHSVGISGTTAIVGAYLDESQRGAAYLYQFDPSSNTWGETKLTASDGTGGHYFGYSVSISDTTALVGAHGVAGMTGAAYVYKLDPSSNTWAETKLTASDGAFNDAFGYRVGLSGSSLIIGAYGDGSNAGAAYHLHWDPSSQNWVETKLTASDYAANDFFGISVAISGTTVVVGASNDGGSRGSAYIYKRTLPASETKLTASDGAVTDQFGRSVAISGTIALIGAHQDNAGAGSAYIFQFDPSSSTWTETKLTASDGAALDNFGVCVAISGYNAIVGANKDASNTGAAYLYQFDPSSNTWTENKLIASDGAVNDYFGVSVAISGTTALVGALSDANHTGAAYLFQFDPSSNTWTENKLIASDGAVNDYFGISVAISGTTAVIGAYGDASNTGAAYVYRFDPSSNTWAETKLIASDGGVDDYFGFNVAISGTTAVIGAHADAGSTGAAYVYRFDPSSNTWAETKLTASDGAVNDAFGISVAISGTTAIIGAYGDAGYTGAGYLFQLDPSSNTWAETKLTASDGTGNDQLGLSVTISATTAIIGAGNVGTGTGAAYLYGF